MSALRQAIRAKLTPEQWAGVEQRYSRFGNPEAARAAYERRQARDQYAKQRGWTEYQGLGHANAQQVHALASRGLIGSQLQQPIGGAPGTPDTGNAFGQGGAKFAPMVGVNAPQGPGPGGSPTPGRPMVPPPMAAATGPAMAGVPAPSGGTPQFTPQSPLAQAMIASFAIPPNKRKSFGRIG